jgi:single-strand DNA-binding protein
MSEGMNRVTLLGNLGAEPELRYTAAGQAVLHLRLATNESWLDKNRERQERVEWHEVVVWGARGEALAKILSKGSCILVEGGLRTHSYEKDGVKRYRTEVVAREVCLTPRRQAPILDESAFAEPSRPGLRNGKTPPIPLEATSDEIPF